MKQTNRSAVGFYTMGIAALFLLGFLMLVTFGARIYRGTVDTQNHNNQTRAMLAYLSSCVKTGDITGAVSLHTGAEGTVLTIQDADAPDYAVRIYLHEGALVEEYTRADAPLSPEEAHFIGETDIFTTESLSGGTLRLTTSSGSVLLHLRSEGGMRP